MRALWSEEFVNFRGEFYEAVDWTCNPKPAHPEGIPIWLGGESKGQLERVGKYADGWLATRASLPTLAESFERAKEAATKAGRDPSKLKLVVDGGATLSSDRLDEAAERLAKLREMGVDHAIVGVHPRELMNAGPVLEGFGAKHLRALA